MQFNENGDIIRIVCDNHSAHKSKETRNYLSTLPEGRFVFVFTPKHGSWLNLVESFFSEMTKQMLKGIRVQSKQELEEQIYLYFDEVSKEPVSLPNWHMQDSFLRILEKAYLENGWETRPSIRIAFQNCRRTNSVQIR